MKQANAELKGDVEAKETERHRACRDLDRLSRYVDDRQVANDGKETKAKEAAGSTVEGAKPDVKSPDKANKAKEAADATKNDETAKMMATLRENMQILSTKLYQERANVDKLKKEVETYKAAELAWRKEEATLKKDFDDQLTQLREEKASVNDEFNKLRHKAKVRVLLIKKTNETRMLVGG